MALSTILLRRTSTCLLSGGSYLSTAAKRSGIIIQTFISSARQFSAYKSNESNIQQPAANIRDVLREIDTLKEEIKSIREKKEGFRKEAPVEEVVFFKEKHPLLKQIESEISESTDYLNSEAKKLQLPPGFEVESDTPGAATVTLKGLHKDELINIKLSIPAYHVMLLTVKVRFPGFLNTTETEFYCTLTSEVFEVESIKAPKGPENGILFYHLPQNLKDEFHNYLKLRGVDVSNALILYRYMLGRLKRDNLKGLENFKKWYRAGIS